MGELAVRLVGVGLVARRRDDRSALIVGDLVRGRLGHRRFVDEIGDGEALGIAAFEPAMEATRSP